MKFFKKMFTSSRNLLKKKVNPAIPNCHCDHRKQKKFTVKIFGHDCTIEKFPMCPSCAEKYLNEHSTICASCGFPILPNEPVGRAWVKAEHPHTHLTFECCATGGLYCGVWGESRLITLHELFPEKYPQGTDTTLQHYLNTGKTVVENP